MERHEYVVVICGVNSRTKRWVGKKVAVRNEFCRDVDQENG